MAAFNPLTIEWIYGNFYLPIRNSSNPLHSSIEACDWRGGLLPTVIAVKRRHASKKALFWTNLLLGWTFFGWIATTVWACLGEKRY
ncbi:MAG TPA: superinfection immunity protein [Candidatus Melainabacteria bacterium]|nr:superinfection immunity protein [Candidatus Melainabacteria bacterium]